MKQRLTNRQRGFTITEMLVGLFLSSIVTLIVFTLFANNTRSTQFTNEVSTVHKNVRLTQLLLNRELLNGNNWGCKTGTQNTINNLDNQSDNSAAGLKNFDYSSNFIAIDDGDDTTPDSFEFITITDTDISLTSAMEYSYSDISVSTLNVTNLQPLIKDDIVLITDCQNADIFMLGEITVATNRIEHKTAGGTGNNNVNSFTNPDCLTGNQEHCLSVAYQDGSKIHYLVRRKFELDAAEESLYVTENNDRQEWIRGIEDMQLQYGIDKNGDDVADVYVNGNDADYDPKKVRTIKLFVLFASERTGIADDKQFEYAGITKDSFNDGRYRYLLESVIQLRNGIGGTQ